MDVELHADNVPHKHLPFMQVSVKPEQASLTPHLHTPFTQLSLLDEQTIASQGSMQLPLLQTFPSSHGEADPHLHSPLMHVSLTVSQASLFPHLQDASLQ